MSCARGEKRSGTDFETKNTRISMEGVYYDKTS